MLWYWFLFETLPLHLNLYGPPVVSHGPWRDREITPPDIVISLYNLPNGSHSVHNRCPLSV